MNRDAQNERTDGGGRNRSRRNRGNRRKDVAATPVVEPVTERVPAFVKLPEPEPIAEIIQRPADIAPPTDKVDIYCVRHSPALELLAPSEYRRGMTTLRHLAVDHFGAATLYCDCVHNGPHEWPPSLQSLETAIELDQFLADSTNDA